jgi:hypothetical protein
MADASSLDPGTTKTQDRLNIRAVSYVEMTSDCKPKITMCRKLHSLREKKENTFEPENISIMYSLYGKNNSDPYIYVI